MQVVRPHPDVLCLQRYTSRDQAQAMLKGCACPTCSTGIVAAGDAICVRCQDEIRLAELDARARAAVLEVAPALYDQPDSFITELAGLPEIKRVLRGTP